MVLVSWAGFAVLWGWFNRILNARPHATDLGEFAPLLASRGSAWVWVLLGGCFRNRLLRAGRVGFSMHYRTPQTWVGSHGQVIEGILG